MTTFSSVVSRRILSNSSSTESLPDSPGSEASSASSKSFTPSNKALFLPYTLTLSDTLPLITREEVADLFQSALN